MHSARRTFVATGLVALLAMAGVTAAIAADRAPAPPPRIAFLANGIVHADALAAGPIAGQLGAPIYTTQPDVLPAGTADALAAYDPELVVVMGGPDAISDAVVAQVSAATGLPAAEPTPTPATGVVRAAGGDRFETATIVADLLDAYAPAYLPVDAQAVDADKLDGKDSSAFALKSDIGAGGGDAETLDGKDSTEFLGAAAKAADSHLLDGKDSTEFLGAAATAADSHLLDGMDSTEFLTDIHQTSAPSSQTLTGATSRETAATVATMELPAGTYAISGQISANALATDRSRLICDVAVDGSPRTTSIASIGNQLGQASQATMGVAGTATLAATATLDLNCWTENLTGEAPFIGTYTSIVAVQMNG